MEGSSIDSATNREVSKDQGPLDDSILEETIETSVVELLIDDDQTDAGLSCKYDEQNEMITKQDSQENKVHSDQKVPINQGTSIDTNLDGNVETLAVEQFIEEDQTEAEMDYLDNTQNTLTTEKVALENMDIEYTCGECLFTATTENHLQAHIGSLHPIVHNDSNPVTRANCSRKITRVTQHNFNKSKRKTTPCEECGKIFKRTNSLIKHKEAVHKKKEYNREKCDFSCYGKCNLSHHILKDNDEAKRTKRKSEPSILCEQCAKSFKSISALRLHVEGVHKTKKYHCDKCDYSCYGYRNYSIHKWEVHNRGPQSFLCDQCDYVTKTGAQLKDHIAIKHLGRTIPCTLCDFVAYYSCQLTHHIRKVHENVRHPCDACDKVFNTITSLKSHKDSIHHNSCLPCPECKFTARSKDYLTKHVRLSHKGTVLRCEFCNYATRDKYLFKTHNLHKHKER